MKVWGREWRRLLAPKAACSWWPRNTKWSAGTYWISSFHNGGGLDRFWPCAYEQEWDTDVEDPMERVFYLAYRLLPLSLCTRVVYQELPEFLKQKVLIDRLAEVVIATARPGLFRVSPHGVGRKGDNRDIF